MSLCTQQHVLLLCQWAWSFAGIFDTKTHNSYILSGTALLPTGMCLICLNDFLGIKIGGLFVLNRARLVQQVLSWENTVWQYRTVLVIRFKICNPPSRQSLDAATFDWRCCWLLWPRREKQEIVSYTSKCNTSITPLNWIILKSVVDSSSSHWRFNPMYRLLFIIY